MIEGVSPVAQALLGTLFTWGVTALGAALVFLVPPSLGARQLRLVLDASLGFSGGVMIAASVWSLLLPAFEFAEATAAAAAVKGEASLFEGRAWVPVSLGFALGGAFVWIAGRFLPDPDAATVAAALGNASGDAAPPRQGSRVMPAGVPEAAEAEVEKRHLFEARRSWRRVLLLVVAITVHNFPEGLAVGVGFGAVGSDVTGASLSTFAAARTLTIGIGLQNFPEGLAVSLPLMRAGYSRSRAFWYGQLSGMVEPVGGFLGAALVALATPFLPYALSFAAGAMIYVVVDDLIPEAHVGGAHNAVTSWGVMVGFLVMMIMDTTL